MKKILFFAALLIVEAGALVTVAKLTEHKEPPPGWTILCDGQGHYAAEFPNSSCAIIGDGFGRFDTRQKAIDSAWFSRKAKPEPNTTTDIDFHDCEGSDVEQ